LWQQITDDRGGEDFVVRITEVSEEHFDPRVLSLYWGFLIERQRIWLRRAMNRPAPWTNDPILQVEFITNVYRQIDPGTEYLVDAILSQDASDEAKVFNVMLYRLMGSKPDTHRHIGFLDPAGYNADTLIARLAELPDDYRIFGDAYRVASYSDIGSDNKVTNVALMFGYLAGGMEETVRRIKASRQVVEVYKVFEVMKGFGEFLAHQIVVDLLYTNSDGQKIVPFTDDEFAKPGPGCRKGIWELMAEDVKPANLTMVLEWLRDHQAEALGDNFPYLANADGSPHYMSLCDIQASLCEFYKYYRLHNGERSVQARRYDGPHRDVRPRMVSIANETVEAVVNDMEPATNLRTVDISPDEVEAALTGEDEPQNIGGGEEAYYPLPNPGVSTNLTHIPVGEGLNIYISINIFTGKSGDDVTT